MADAADKPDRANDPGRELDELRAEIDATCDDLEGGASSSDATSPSADQTGQDAIDSVEQITEDLDDLTAAIDELLHGASSGGRNIAPSQPPAPVEVSTELDDALEREVGELSESVEEMLAEAASAAMGESGGDRSDQPSTDRIAEPADAIDEALDNDDAPDPERAPEPADALTETTERDDAPDPERAPEPADVLPTPSENESLGDDEPIAEPADAIDEVLDNDDAPDPERAPEPADQGGAVATSEPRGLDDLDDELAAVSDALIQQDRVGPGAFEAPHPLGEESPAELSEETEEHEPADEAPTPRVAAETPARVEPRAEPAPASDSVGFLGRLRAAAAQAWAHTGPLARRATPHGATLLLVLSKPLETRPARLRQTVGWLALYTAFMAACVWVYIVFVRSAPAPLNDAVPTNVISSPTSPDATPRVEDEATDD
ncbi:MAG: hypothetical protein R3B57_02900 [Phycisphaerales bacterium]